MKIKKKNAKAPKVLSKRGGKLIGEKEVQKIIAGLCARRTIDTSQFLMPFIEKGFGGQKRSTKSAV